MNALTLDRGAATPWSRPQQTARAVLFRRQPNLAWAGLLFLLATLPLLVAMSMDSRTVNDINVWIKPIKFLASLTVYYWTLAWMFGYLPDTAQRGRAGRFVIFAPLVAGVLEMAWLIGMAALGQPAHFNRGTPLYQLLYVLAGVGSLVLITAVLLQAIMLARLREVAIDPAFRLALVLGGVLGFVLTLISAGHMAAGTGHWVGGARSDLGGVTLMGWSHSGGDLRVAHFFALHATQFLPVAGWLITRTHIPAKATAVWLAAGAYLAMVAFTFIQALSGQPFLP